MSYLNEIRRMLFLFCMVETLANVVLMRLKLTAFYVVYKNPHPLLQEWMYFCYLVAFYVFTVQNLFAGVSLCTSNQPSILYEVLRPLISCLLYVVCPVLALFSAESDLTNATKKSDNQPLRRKPLHPYFKFNHLHSQAVASMVCSVLHVLHFLAALYVLLYNKDTDRDRETSSSDLSGDVVTAVGKNFQWCRNYTSLEGECN